MNAHLPLMTKHFSFSISLRVAVGSLSNNHMVLSAHVVQTEQLRLKYSSQEGQSALEAETVFVRISLTITVG